MAAAGVIDVILLGLAGMVGGLINCVSSGGSFLTYPALLATGLTPVQAAASTLTALTPGNIAAIPEFWPEVLSNRRRYPAVLATVGVGSVVGILLLFVVGAEGFETVVPWLVLGATLAFAASDRVRIWAVANARSLTDGRAGAVVLFGMSVYLTFFGSGVGNLFLALFIIRGFGDFLAANAAKNVAMSLGTLLATVAYSVAGYVRWEAVIPVLVGSAIGGRYGSRFARGVPLPWLRGFVVAFGLSTALWLLLRTPG